MEKLLLHVCCAPCATAVCERLCEQYDITLFFYNPCIEPKEEHDKRLLEVRRLAEHFKIPLIEGIYDNDSYREVIKGNEGEKEGGKRCTICFDQRLKEAAEIEGFDLVTTTLTISPHKNAPLINEIGKLYAGDRWLASDFKKKNGYKRSIEMCRELDIYRQNYCGCLFSKRAEQ